MLRSMTGFGEARRRAAGMTVSVELRSVNNRYFKLVGKCPEGYGILETEIETRVRDRVKRGSVQATLRMDRAESADDYRLNAAVLDSYRRQLQSLAEEWDLPTAAVEPHRLLELPGVVSEARRAPEDAMRDWPLFRDVLDEALDRLCEMRTSEGEAMAEDCQERIAKLAEQLAEVKACVPSVVADFRDRITERVNALLAEHDVIVQPDDLIREISVFADRCDVT
ncbi:MAG: hypothetical protein N2C14_33985 [Planctomycetales bacterium]